MGSARIARVHAFLLSTHPLTCLEHTSSEVGHLHVRDALEHEDGQVDEGERPAPSPRQASAALGARRHK